jgi:hypothetical protein
MRSLGLARSKANVLVTFHGRRRHACICLRSRGVALGAAYQALQYVSSQAPPWIPATFSSCKAPLSA